MNILFTNMLDPEYVKGHKRLDCKIIDALASFAQVELLAPFGYYVPSPSSAKIIEINNIKEYEHNKYSLSIARQCIQLDKLNGYDFIFLESYNIYALEYLFLNLRNADKRIFVVQHNNLDYLEKSRKARFVYRLYSKKINHIVLSKFIGNYLINCGIDKNKVFVIPHPIINPPEGDTIKEFDCVGISNSNDENWIKRIVEEEELNEIFLRKKLKVVLRSRELEFNNGALEVIRGFLPQEKYKRYTQGAKSVFLPFPYDFKYRMSATIVDALANRSIVISTNTLLAEYYSQMYPKLVYIISKPDDLNSIIGKAGNSLDDKSFKQFIEYHSDETVKKALFSCFIGYR